MNSWKLTGREKDEIINDMHMNAIQAMAKDRTDQATLYRRLLCAPSLESILITTHQTNNTCSDKLGFLF
jgi:hypothetical protein